MDTFTTLLVLMLQLTKQPATVVQQAGVDIDAVCATEPTARLCGIAHDIVDAVDHATRLPFDGPAAKEASAIALLAVAHHESGLRANIQDCSLCDAALTDGSGWCDGGRSISMYQLMVGRAWAGHTREEICTDNRLATKLALRWLTHFSRNATPATMFRTYAGCKARSCPAADRINAGFEPLARKVGIDAVPTVGPRHFRTRPPRHDDGHERSQGK